MGESVLQVRGKMSKAVSVRHPSGSSRGNTLWKVRDAKGRGDAYYDQASEQTIVDGDAVRQDVLGEHLQQPAKALDEALRRVVVWDDADSRESEPQRLLSSSRRADIVECACLCRKTRGAFCSPDMRTFGFFFFEKKKGHTVTGDCCSVALSPIKDGLQQQGEGCGERLAHAPLDGANVLCMKLCVFFFLFFEK